MQDFGVASLGRVWLFFLSFFLVCLGADFWCVFLTFSAGGNLGLHDTWSDYLRIEHHTFDQLYTEISYSGRLESITCS